MDFYNELHRPQFHFSARENWINDPNGLVYDKGVWHLYFQHNPKACVWGEPWWGHAISSDLVHWREQEGHALHPDEHGAMFSGSAVVDHDDTAGFGKGTLLAFYTAAGAYANPERPFTQCLAYSRDNGMNWTKYDRNPIVGCIEAGNRDPKVVWHKETRRWIMALYLADDRYCLLSSPDARSWTQIQDVTLEDDNECPDFFALNDESGTERWVLWGAKGHYLVGSFDGEKFTTDSSLQMAEVGRNGYAAQTWDNAPDGRRIQISWMAGGLYPEMPFNQQLSIPVELSLRGQGKDAALVRWPVSELDSLRQRTIRHHRCTISPKKPFVVDTNATLLDAEFRIRRETSSTLYVVIRGQALVFDWSRKEMRFDNGFTAKVAPKPAAVSLPTSSEMSIRLLIDKTSIEVFIERGLISASFCFLPDGYLSPLVMHSYSGDQIIEDFELRELVSTWHDPD